MNYQIIITYPNNDLGSQIIIDEIHLEEQNFFETIENGMAILDKAIDELKLNKKFKILIAIKRGEYERRRR